jgi:hypothetical protein
MSDDGRMSFLRVVAENASSPGKPLSEDEFFRAMDAIIQHRPGPTQFLTSPAVIAKGREQAALLRLRAQKSYMEWLRLPWWRWWRRKRLAESFMRARVDADALEATFGR